MMLEPCPFCVSNTHSDIDKADYPECTRKFISKTLAWHLTGEGKDPDAEIHVFCNPQVNMLVGADWSKQAIKKLIEEAKYIELCDADGHARGMKHGICVRDKEDRQWFVETDEGLLKDFEDIYLNG